MPPHSDSPPPSDQSQKPRQLTLPRALTQPGGEGNVTDGLATGFPSIDRVLGGGVRRGDLVILGGDVGSGKSSLALAIALRMTEVGRKVAFLSGEMSTDRLVERSLAIEGRVRVDDLRRDTLPEPARSAVNDMVTRLEERSPHFERLPASGIDALRDRLPDPIGFEVVMVDSLQDVADSAQGRSEGEAAAVRALKRLALDHDIAVIVTAHLPGLSRDRQDLRPRLEDYGALGAPGQHADVVLGLFREEMYASAAGVEGATELVVNKNRNGGTGWIDLYFYKQWLRFEDMLDPDR